jgi:hypothetical protein
LRQRPGLRKDPGEYASIRNGQKAIAETTNPYDEILRLTPSYRTLVLESYEPRSLLLVSR